MFVITILGAYETDIRDALQAGNISEVDTQVIKDAFSMSFLPYPGNPFDVDGVIYTPQHVIHKAGSDNVKMIVEIPDPVVPPDPPSADFTKSPDTAITVGEFITFTPIEPENPANSYSWKGNLDGQPLNEFSTSYSTGKFFPPAPGSYTVELTVTNISGTDTETKVGYLIVNPAP